MFISSSVQTRVDTFYASAIIKLMESLGKTYYIK